MSDGALNAETEAQICAVGLEHDKPVVICDVDEVLFQFLIPLERYLADVGHRLEMRSNASLFGNVYATGSETPIENEEVGALLEKFYERDVESQPPIPGAAAALAGLSKRARVVIITNLPAAYGSRRQRALRVHGMDYPLIVNSGPKGKALAKLLHGHKAPSFFIEDMHMHLVSAAQIKGLHCVQFAADTRLARLVKRAENAYHAKGWGPAARYIEARLDQAGRTSVTSGM
ncbi:MAG: hypothetical protein OXF24_01655 [Hyphomicrobiales bacterium]|nr:hypothetical protein [Hyphomicrobiales bacterium]MCY4048275.1 hypothetical protein [Hyphomicrobiales bacterium]